MPQPLVGIRVIDLTRYVAGPYSTAILADMGAEVIEVEPPGGAEGRRSGVLHQRESVRWQIYHRNKKSIMLNLRSDAGKEILRELVRRSDLLAENFRPGTLDKMGFSFAALCELKPDFILLSISGFGQFGPYAHRPGFDAIAQAMSGLMSLTGEPDGEPVVCGPGFFGDIAAGTWAALGAVLALFYRERTGQGQHVDVSLFESVMPFLMTTISDFVATRVPPSRMGNRDRSGIPANAFKTSDGMVYLDAGSGGLFGPMFETMGLPEVANDPRFKTYAGRRPHLCEIEQIVAEWMGKRTTQEAIEILERVVPIGPVRTVPQVVNCPQLRERGYLVELDDPRVRGLLLPGVPLHMSASPGKVERAAPPPGQHNQEIYGQLLGYGEDRLAELAAIGVI